MYQDPYDETKVTLIEIYSDQASHLKHMSTPHNKFFERYTKRWLKSSDTKLVKEVSHDTRKLIDELLEDITSYKKKMDVLEKEFEVIKMDS